MGGFGGGEPGGGRGGGGLGGGGGVWGGGGGGKTLGFCKRGGGVWGPYLSVRTPFQHVEDGWQAPLEWLPDDFLPYAHQAESFERLSSVGGHQPEPTLVTTGTGSGKTECFLYPVLDHCARMRDEGQVGASRR